MPRSLYISIRGDYSEFEKDLARVRALAKQNGNAISQALGNSIRPDKAVKSLQHLAEAVRGLNAATKTYGMRAEIQGLQDLARFAGVSEKQMRSLTRAMQDTARQNALNRSLQELQRQTGMSNMGLAWMRIKLGDVSGAMDSLADASLNAKLKLAAIAYAVIGGGKAAIESTAAFQRLQKSFTAIEGSEKGGEQLLSFIREQAEQLGLEYRSTAESAKTFFAAAAPTSMKDKAREIFTAFSEAGTAMSLSTDQMQGVFLALGQMISKGKVQAEELRGQLGERLPGAFQLAAQAMNMTTAELDKFMADGKLTAEDLLPKLARALHDEFGEAAKDSANGVQQAVNRLTTEWETFKSSLDERFIVGVIEHIADAVRTLSGVVANLGRAFQLFGEFKAGNLSFAEYASMGPEKAAKWLEHRFSKEGVTKLRDKEFAELKRMQENAKGYAGSIWGYSDEDISTQRKKVQDLNSELAAINAKAEKEQQQQARQAKKEALRIEQQKNAEIKAVMDNASKSYSKAMQDNISQRLAVLQNEEASAIKAQEAAWKQGSMSQQQYEQRKTEIQAEYAKKRQELQDRENRKISGAGGRKASSSSAAGKDITQLEAQINRLRMSGSEFKEWELTNVTIPRMLHDFPGATEKVREFAEAQRKAFADEAAKEAQEENKKQMSERARLLKELADLSGDVNMGQEAQNMLLEQQAQAFRDSLGPSMDAYIDKWKELQQLKNNEDFGSKIKNGFQDAYKSAMDIGGNLVNAANGWADSFATAIGNMAAGGKASFKDLANSIISDLARMTVKMLIYSMVSKAAGLFTKAADPNPMVDFYAGMEFANGGVLSGGTLSRYSGTVVDRPTLFTYGSSLKKFARGAGLMGEAGPEAIMPLRRHNGRLGVDASGSSPRVNVVINNMAGAQVETEQRQNADGSIDIEATILGAVNRDLSRRGGQLNRTMRSQWGARSIVTQR